MRRLLPVKGWFEQHGFSFTETMIGTHRFLDPHQPQGNLRVTFTADALSRSFRQFLPENGSATPSLGIDGMIHVEGLADWNGLSGSLKFDILHSHRLTYSFDFGGDDGTAYRFEGMKTLNPLHPIASLLNLDGKIIRKDDHKMISVVKLAFEAHLLIPFLMTFRIQNSAPGGLVGQATV